MGVWSIPLTTRCYDKEGKLINSENICIDFSKVTQNQTNYIHKLEGHNTIVEGITTFEKSIMATCNSSRIWGYFDIEEKHGWKQYFTILLNQNPNVYDAQAHFYCEDFNFPYVIRMKRNMKLSIKRGHYEHIMYSTINYDATEDEEFISFSKDLYFKALDYPKKFWSVMITFYKDGMSEFVVKFNEMKYNSN